MFVARLAGTAVFDPNGDQVGRVRDVVVIMRADRPPRVIGIVAEVPGRRRIFLPITRITAVDTGQVITTGLLNIKRFEQRPGETLVLGELLDRRISTKDETVHGTVVDVGIEQARTGDWVLAKLAVREGGRPVPPPRTDARARLVRRRRPDDRERGARRRDAAGQPR